MLGKAADAGQLVSFTKKWKGAFGSKTGKATKVLSNTLLPHLPDKAALKIQDALTGGKASKLGDAGLSRKQIGELSGSGKLDDVDPDEVQRLAKQDGTEPKHIKTLEGVIKRLSHSLYRCFDSIRTGLGVRSYSAERAGNPTWEPDKELDDGSYPTPPGRFRTVLIPHLLDTALALQKPKSTSDA
ncbi:hypothetical protein [Natrinema caseinilyticum]|uniref:hypothetical protein n=1 Tax=Natrinema caseinilyticum TaxID=2961570 RepID=UPI0020C25252|nr:hypothetical protein [Natrinema caseinilyticum]